MSMSSASRAAIAKTLSLEMSCRKQGADFWALLLPFSTSLFVLLSKNKKKLHNELV